MFLCWGYKNSDVITSVQFCVSDVPLFSLNVFIFILRAFILWWLHFVCLCSVSFATALRTSLLCCLFLCLSFLCMFISDKSSISLWIFLVCLFLCLLAVSTLSLYLSLSVYVCLCLCICLFVSIRLGQLIDKLLLTFAIYHSHHDLHIYLFWDVVNELKEWSQADSRVTLEKIFVRIIVTSFTILINVEIIITILIISLISWSQKEKFTAALGECKIQLACPLWRASH